MEVETNNKDIWKIPPKKRCEIKQQITRLNKQCVKEDITREIRNYFERKDNENITSENLWEAAKATLRGKFIVLSAYIGKDERFKFPC